MAHRPPPPRTYSKSPKRVIKLAQQVARALPPYFSRFSRKDFTIQQLLPLLVLRVQFDLGYRAVHAMVADLDCIAQWLGLTRVPHYSTLCRAAARLATCFSILFDRVVRMAQAAGLFRRPATLAIDCSGCEDRHTSKYYAARCRGEPAQQRYWTKLAVACDTRTHFFVGILALRAPGNECGLWKPLLAQACARIKVAKCLGDAGFDSEENHAFAREVLKVPGTCIALNPRNHGRRTPQTRYRREMHSQFPLRTYRQRSHVESAFSQHKRALSSDLTARSERTRISEVLLRGLTHNILLLQRRKGLQQSPP